MCTFWNWVVRYTRLVIWFSMLLFVCTKTVANVESKLQAITIHPQFYESKIGKNIELFADPSAQLTLQQILSPDISRRFVASTQDTPNFGYTNSAIWISFRLDDRRYPSSGTSYEPLYLVLAFAVTDRADLWCKSVLGNPIVQQIAGDHVPRSEWPNGYREPAFKIPSGTEQCWMRVQSSASIQLPVTLYSQEAFVNLRLQDNTLQALYFGALLVMLGYNAAVAISTRSRGYAAYTLFLLSYGLLQCALSGFGYAILWKDASGVADALVPFFIACVGMTSTVFAMILLDLRQTAPRWFKLGKYVLFLCSFNLLFPWFLPFSTALQTILFLIPFWAIFLLGSGIYLSRKGYRIAKIYLAAWMVFILGAILAGSLTWLPANPLTINAMQIGSVIEFIMLSFALSDRIKTIQAALLTAQKKIADTLYASEQQLERKVKDRTLELQERTTQLIAAEKMASLGLLVSNVAHEINTPIGAVKSSGAFIAETLESTLAEMPKLFALLEPVQRGLFVQMVLSRNGSAQPFNLREERTITKKIVSKLEQANVEDAIRKARLLTKLRAHQTPLDYLPLLQHPESDFILSVAGNIADVVNSTHNINIAVEKVSRVVYALKALSGDDVVKAAIVAPLQPDMEKALAKYQNQMQSIELVKNYQADMPAIHADHDAVTQLCIHLVMNALQAMNYEGRLTVGLEAEKNLAIITVEDTGSGIADDIKDRIFEPFFTTRTSGEGSGMGLAIVKRIVEQHQGKIEVKSEFGTGTTVTVSLPYQ